MVHSRYHALYESANELHFLLLLLQPLFIVETWFVKKWWGSANIIYNLLQFVNGEESSNESRLQNQKNLASNCEALPLWMMQLCCKDVRF